MKKRMFFVSMALIVLGAVGHAWADEQQPELKFKQEFIRRLAVEVPGVLKGQNPKTGRFGTGIWLVTDQNVVFSLAAAWSIKSPDNPYYHDPKLLKAIVAAGDALIADMNPNGSWEFRKKDGSTWGEIYMPWTYSAWIKSYSLVREGMTPEQQKRWDAALTLGFDGISKTCLIRVHNIPTNQASALYIAGQVLNRPEWCSQAKEFMAKVTAAQDPAGFWSENYGPVVNYGNVYTDALGVYYASSHDEAVRPTIERAAHFYSNVIYPNGDLIETVDERNPYHPGLWFPNVLYTFTPEGRGHIQQQLDILAKQGKKIAAEHLANYLIYGQEGPATPTAAQSSDGTVVLDNGKALMRRKGPWFVCLSAYQCPIPTVRWIQDRQNLVSIYHDKCGLILGGGNTKLQPLWSNFTVGDTSLLKHTPGDEHPDFLPKGPLFHVPSSASLKKTDPVGLNLQYGDERCHIYTEPLDDQTMLIHLQASANSGMPVEGHVTLIPHVGEAVRTANGKGFILGKNAFTMTSEEAGGWIAHAGWKITLPEGSKVVWPVLPHNPYKKDGSAGIGEGRLVISIPFSPSHEKQTLTLSIE